MKQWLRDLVRNWFVPSFHLHFNVINLNTIFLILKPFFQFPILYLLAPTPSFLHKGWYVSSSECILTSLSACRSFINSCTWVSFWVSCFFIFSTTRELSSFSLVNRVRTLFNSSSYKQTQFLLNYFELTGFFSLYCIFLHFIVITPTIFYSLFHTFSLLQFFTTTFLHLFTPTIFSNFLFLKKIVIMKMFMELLEN